jgi:hypothetical protein
VGEGVRGCANLTSLDLSCEGGGVVLDDLMGVGVGMFLWWWGGSFALGFVVKRL